MTKIAIVGTSHVAALKLGWDEIASDHPDVSIEFLATKASNFGAFRLYGDLTFGLRKRSLQKKALLEKKYGKSSIELGKADAVLFAGVGSAFSRFSELISAVDVSGIRETGAPTLLSKESCDALLRGIVRDDLPEDSWRNWNGPPLFLSYPPIPTEDCGEIVNESAMQRFGDWSRIVNNPAGLRPLLSLLFDIAEEELAKAGIRFLRQPEETRTEIGMTRPELKTGAARVGGEEFSKNNFNHMNSQFGTLMLEQLLREVGVDAHPSVAV